MAVGDDDEVAAAPVLDTDGGLTIGVEHLSDARRGEQDLADFLTNRRIKDGDMRDLVVDDSEGLRIKSVEGKAAVLGLELEPAVSAQDLIQRNGAIDGGDGVFGDDEDFDAAGFEEFGEVADELIDIPTRDVAARIGRSEALEVVIEVREVDQTEVGLLMLFNPAGRIGDPLRGRQAGARAPERMEREIAKFALEQLLVTLRITRDIEDLTAVGLIDWSRRDGDVRGGTHIVPPEKVRDLELGILGVELVPDLRRQHDAVRLLPELHLAERAVIPTVTDDAMRARLLTGQVVGLRSAGDSGERGADLRDATLGGARGETWHHAGTQVPGGETDDV